MQHLRYCRASTLRWCCTRGELRWGRYYREYRVISSRLRYPTRENARSDPALCIFGPATPLPGPGAVSVPSVMGGSDGYFSFPLLNGGNRKLSSENSGFFNVAGAAIIQKKWSDPLHTILISGPERSNFTPGNGGLRESDVLGGSGGVLWVTTLTSGSSGVVILQRKSEDLREKTPVGYCVGRYAVNSLEILKIF